MIDVTWSGPNNFQMGLRCVGLSDQERQSQSSQYLDEVLEFTEISGGFRGIEVDDRRRRKAHH
jgi:hypothetical protein